MIQLVTLKVIFHLWKSLGFLWEWWKWTWGPVDLAWPMAFVYTNAFFSRYPIKISLSSYWKVTPYKNSVGLICPHYQHIVDNLLHRQIKWTVLFWGSGQQRSCNKPWLPRSSRKPWQVHFHLVKWHNLAIHARDWEPSLQPCPWFCRCGKSFLPFCVSSAFSWADYL